MDQLTPNEAPMPGEESDDQDTNTPWPTDEKLILAHVKELRTKSEQALGDWYDEAVIDFQFAEGKQWDDDDIARMESENRVAATFNRVAPIVNAILGQEVCNRQEVRYLPRRVGEVNAADPMNDAVKWVREQCNAEDEDSDAFADMTTCGMGWTCTRMEYEEAPEGMPDVTRRDPMLMRWDPAARKKNVADKRWVQADYWMSQDEIEDRWPDADLSAATNLKSPTDRPQPHDQTEAWKYKNDASGMDRYGDELRCIHHVEKYSIKVHKAVDPTTGQMQEFNDSQRATIEKNAPLAGVDVPEFVTVKKRVFWEAWTVGGVVLMSGQAASQRDFQYQAMTCYRERETGYWYGVVRMMRDPQRYANRLMSLMMSILATGAKGGMMYETGAFVNPKKAKADWAKHDSAIELTQGAIAGQKIQPKEGQQMPPGAADLMQFAVTSLRDVVGFGPEMLGQNGGSMEKNAEVEDMRTKAGITLLGRVFDALRLYRKRQGVILAEFVTRFISDGRLIRVLGKQGEQFIPLIRQPDNVEYDLVIDESPTSRDVKEKTWGALQIMVPMAMQAGMPLPNELLDYAPLPQSLATAWKQKIAQAQQQPPQPPVQVQVEQLKQQGKQAEIQGKSQADAMKTQVQAASDAAKAQAQQQVEAAQMQADMTVEHMKAVMKEQGDNFRNQLEAQRSMLENNNAMQLETLKAHMTQQTAVLVARINAASKVEAARESGIKKDDGAVALQ